jgi:hypothetical protein
MVNQVLADSKEKLASDSSFGLDKTASVAEPQPVSADSHKVASKHTVGDLNKLADACDHLAKNIHLVNDDRTPQEKLAEYTAIHSALRKHAEDGDNSTGNHQTQKALPKTDPPSSVTPDDSGTGVGSGNAIPSSETNTPGTSLDAGESGSATGAHQSPAGVSPTEKPNPLDAANALETNQEMMMPEQPDDVLKQAAVRKKAMVLATKARRDGVPPSVARALMKVAGFGKLAEDALNPANVQAGTEPLLQSEPGAPSALMQGSTVGTNTPRETAPTTGEGGGRDLIGSVESAINATKGQAKKQNKGALAELLTEPMQTSATDKTLDKSLDNTSSAGVKISSAQANAARELLRKFAGSSPDNHKKVAALAKLALDPDMAAGGGAVPPQGGPMAAPPDEAVPAEEPAPPPVIDPAAAMAAEGGGEEAVSDEALEAAKSGVTPEEVAQAEQLLTQQGAMAAEAAEADQAAQAEQASEPEAGGKMSQGLGGNVGMGSMGSSMPMA